MKTSKFNTLKAGSFQLMIVIILLLTFSCKDKNVSAQKAGSTTTSKTDVKPPQIDIHTAVISDNMDVVKQHIAAGSNINEKDPFGGSSPLISAALFGKTDMVKVLLDAGADINFQNNDGSTALNTAAFFCRPEIVKILLAKSADKTIKNKYGATPYQSVAGPYKDVKNVYEMMDKMLAPMGLKTDYVYIEKTRPVIASMLK